MKRIGIIALLACSALILSACENLTLGVKYGDWKYEKEFKLKDIKEIKIEINEIKDKAEQDVKNPDAPIVAPQETAPQQ